MRSTLKRKRSLFWAPIAGPRPAARRSEQAPSADTGHPLPSKGQVYAADGGTQHVLVDVRRNEALRQYETQVMERFDCIEALLRRIAAEQHRDDFPDVAQRMCMEQLGFSLPTSILSTAWSGGLDIKRLYAYCVFEVFKRMSREFFQQDPLHGQEIDAVRQRFLAAGIHAIGVAPCADGRLAHVVSYVLRLPYGLVRRKAHAGALFDVSESVRNWVFVEHSRFRQGIPNAATEPTRYLKIAVYHYSASDPHHSGCAAHGSNDEAAAKAAMGRLKAFRDAIENRFGCGSTIETLLIGVNTDDDSLRVHVPNRDGNVCLNRYVETAHLYDMTEGMSVEVARNTLQAQVIESNVSKGSTAPAKGMFEIVCWLIENNFSQVAYVKDYHASRYADIGHAERFIGIGHGFDEVQLRNLTYYGYLDTLEEGAADMDVGVKIFDGLNVQRGLPIPVVLRCDFDGRVPGSRERALEKVRRIEAAVLTRYEALSREGLLVTLCTLRDVGVHVPCELVGSSLDLEAQGGH
jgi:carboxysome shell carbonic anhydrase